MLCEVSTMIDELLTTFNIDLSDYMYLKFALLLVLVVGTFNLLKTLLNILFRRH